MSALLPSEVLSRAADLIEPAGCWTQFAAAAEAPLLSEDDVPTDEDGDAVEANEMAPQMRCWCATGAIWRVAALRAPASLGDPRAVAAAYVKRVVGEHVPDWNDAPDRTQAEVVAALRKASELAKAAGQ